MSSKPKSSKAPTQPKGIFDGIENTSAAVFGLFSVMYFALLPATFYITKPGGFVQLATELVWKTLLPHSNQIPKDRIIPALATVYLTFAYAVTGAFSVTALGLGRKEKFDNSSPRALQADLRGFPLRLRSAHQHLMENFPPWAIVAALAQVTAPTNQVVLNLLGLNLLLKCCVHYPAYLFDASNVRAFTHLLATSAIMAAAYSLATGAR